MKIRFKIWRQVGPDAAGAFQEYALDDITDDMSLLEALDVLNEDLVHEGKEPVAFDHDCREGICGTCGAMVDGQAHGPGSRTTLCQVHMRSFSDGAVITLEPFRATAFPVVQDLVVDRASFDRIIQSGGYISVRTGSAQDANNQPIGKEVADVAFDAAACIGCGACVAACPNASAMLVTSAKISHLGMLPQGQPERWSRVLGMVQQMDEEGFGSCTNHGECEAACPKGISLDFIARMNRDMIRATLGKKDKSNV